jgi:transcriptional regulator of met regulon
MMDINSQLETVWDALHGFREDCISEGDPMHDEQWDEICEAMARIMEELGVKHEELD